METGDKKGSRVKPLRTQQQPSNNGLQREKALNKRAGMKALSPTQVNKTSDGREPDSEAEAGTKATNRKQVSGASSIVNGQEQGRCE